MGASTFETPLRCGHVLTFDGVPPRCDSIVWCRRCDRGAVVAMRSRRAKMPARPRKRRRVRAA